MPAKPTPAVIGPRRHERVRWMPGDPRKVVIHTFNEDLRGQYRRPKREADALRAQFDAATRRFDSDAAVAIVNRVFNDGAGDLIVDRLEGVGLKPRLVLPTPPFEHGTDTPDPPFKATNALPHAYAGVLAAYLDGEVDYEIRQVARVGRTKLRGFERFLWQPCFRGTVRNDSAYILVDDVYGVGGTFAALRSYIVANGGTVVAATTLSHREPGHKTFPIAERTLAVLNQRYSGNVGACWSEEIGHDVACLTDGEGVFLLDWWEERCRTSPGAGPGSLQRLRAELARTSASGSD